MNSMQIIKLRSSWN